MSELVTAYLPEFVILIFVVFNIVGALFFGTNSYKLSKWITLLGIVMAIASTFYLQIEPDVYVFNGTFLTNIYTVFFKILILMAGFFLTLLSRNMLREKKDRAFEYFSVFLSGLLFSMCAISSVNFIVLYVSLSALSLCCYLLLVFNKKQNSKQLTFGYLIQNSFAYILFLGGLSFIYGISSQFGFEEISSFLSKMDFANQPQLLLSLSLILVMCIHLFKLGVVPFSSWLPDTFEGASPPIGAYLSTIPVVASIGVLARLFMVFLNYTIAIKIVFAVVSIITIIFGSFSAIRQKKLCRFMAYSMSVQSGIMLLGLCVFSVYSLSAVLFYLFCYLFINIGIWAAVILLNDSSRLESLDDIKGLIYTRPYFVTAFTMLLISMAGLAPTCGFISKLYVFSAVARSGFVYLPILVIALLAMVIMLYAYWCVIKVMYQKVQVVPKIDCNIISSKFILYACSIISVTICFYADKLIHLCQLVAYFM